MNLYCITVLLLTGMEIILNMKIICVNPMSFEYC